MSRVPVRAKKVDITALLRPITAAGIKVDRIELGDDVHTKVNRHLSSAAPSRSVSWIKLIACSPR